MSKGDAAGEALEILNAAQLFADFAAYDGLLDEVSDGVEARCNGFAVDKRAKDPRAEKASAHAGDGDVESGDERCGSVFGGFVGKDGSKELEIADGDGIEDEGVVLYIEANAIEVLQSGDGGSGEWRVTSGERTAIFDYGVSRGV